MLFPRFCVLLKLRTPISTISTMPRTGFKTSPAPAIELDGDLSPHLLGDTLTGYVVDEKSPQQQSSDSFFVNLKLFGRVKT